MTIFHIHLIIYVSLNIYYKKYTVRHFFMSYETSSEFQILLKK